VKVVLLPQAQKNLDEIYDPIYSRIVKRLRLLEKTPRLGAPMSGPFAGFRSTVVGMFRIVYRIVNAKKVEIAYVRHCRRAPPA
jgi:mRNA-degrading endonuclease RelE of RelBE toxin-antitoxin system